MRFCGKWCDSTACLTVQNGVISSALTKIDWGLVYYFKKCYTKTLFSSLNSLKKIFFITTKT